MSKNYTPPILNHKFWDQVDLNGPYLELLGSKCWLWQGSTRSDGYGVFYIGFYKDKKYFRIRAHRAAYEDRHQEFIPDDLVLDHLCRVRNCVNPDHLEIVSNGENVLRGIGFAAENAVKTHCPRGHEYSKENTIYDTNGSRVCYICNHNRTSGTIKDGTFYPTCTKLNEEQVKEIVAKYIPKVVTYKQLAKEYNVSAGTIAHIIKGRTWNRVIK